MRIAEIVNVSFLNNGVMETTRCDKRTHTNYQYDFSGKLLKMIPMGKCSCGEVSVTKVTENVLAEV